MGKQTSPYTALPFKGSRSIVTRRAGRLYLAHDHLLYVEEGTVASKARRFFFRDIQMVSYAQNRWWLISGGIRTLFAAISGLLTIIVLMESVSTNFADGIFGLLFLAAIYVVFAIGALRKFLGGPSCRCYINTAVQETELLAVQRMRQAYELIAILRPHIEAAQAVEAGIVTQTPPEEAAEVVVPSRFSESHYAGAGIQEEKAPFRARFHVAAFLLASCMGISWLIDLVAPSNLKDNIDYLMLIACLVLLTIALVSQYRTQSPLAVRWVTWLVLGTIVAFLAWSFLFGMILAVSNPEMINSSRSLVTRDVLEMPAFQSVMIAASCALLVLSTLGLFRLSRFQGTDAQSPDGTMKPGTVAEAPAPEDTHE